MGTVLRALRRARSVRALALAMLLCVVSASVSALLHSEDDDALCSVVVEQHDHNAHRIGGASHSTPGADHCFICHSQSLRSLVSTGTVSFQTRTEAHLNADLWTWAGSHTPSRQPARAPPLA